MSNLLLCVGLICGSIIWVEIVRDSYHALAHHWQPLYRLHVWHHRVFRPDLSVMSKEIYRRAHWYNDVPEALVMLAASVLPVLLAYSWGFDRPWLGWLGSLYTLAFLSTAIGRGLGIANLEELTDLTHRPGQFESF
ncbi:MAG: sterol desaturase, partial [bacterium]